MSGKSLLSDDRGSKRDSAKDPASEARVSSAIGAAERLMQMKEALTEAGLSEDEIARVAQKVPDLNVKLLKPRPGEKILRTSADAATLSRMTECAVVFKVNGSVVVALPGDSKVKIAKNYKESKDAARKSQIAADRIAKEEARDAAFKSQMESTFETLPEFFKEWVSGREDGNYGREINISIAKDAHVLVTTLQTLEAIQGWYKLRPDRQAQIVKGLSRGHSNTSFKQMVSLACSYLYKEGAAA